MPFWVQFWSRMQSSIVFCGSIEGKAGNRCFPTNRDRRTVFDTVITTSEGRIQISEWLVVSPIMCHTNGQDYQENSYRYPQSQMKCK